MQDKKQTPPATDKDPDRQQDDNIDDLGRRPDGTEMDQPGAAEPAKEENPDTRH